MGQLRSGKAHCRSLGLPNFLLILVALIDFNAVFSYGKPHTRLSLGAAWQEIRLRSG